MAVRHGGSRDRRNAGFSQASQNWVGAVGPLLCAVFLTLGLYWGGRSYTYYFFIYAGFTCLAGVVAIHIAAGLYEMVWGKGPKRNSQPGKGMLALAAVLTLVLTGASYQLCANTYLLGVPKEDCVQYKFADIIHEKENATLLNYGFLDAGFYYAADILPVNKYFACSIFRMKTCRRCVLSSARSCRRRAWILS